MKRRIFLLSILLPTLSGCATTDLTNSWKDPQYSGGPVTKVLVLGISDQVGVRRAFEDTLAQALTRQGVQAVASYTLIPGKGKIAEEALKKAVEQAGVDGILITRMVRSETETVVSHTTMAPPAYGYRRPYYGYYTGSWNGHYEPATVLTTEYVVGETTLFRADAPEPVWSGTTRSVRAGDVRKATEDFASVMIAAMKKEGLI